jgi:hypothetical protein
MKWSAFPSLKMAMDLSIEKDLDETREIAWQIEDYFNLSQETDANSTSQLVQLIGENVVLPISYDPSMNHCMNLCYFLF